MTKGLLAACCRHRPTTMGFCLTLPTMSLIAYQPPVFDLSGGLVGLTPLLVEDDPLTGNLKFDMGVSFGNIPYIYTCFLNNKMLQKLWPPGPHWGSYSTLRLRTWWGGDSLPPLPRTPTQLSALWASSFGPKYQKRPPTAILFFLTNETLRTAVVLL